MCERCLWGTRNKSAFDGFEGMTFIDADLEMEEEEKEEHRSETTIIEREETNYRGAAHSGCNLQYRTGWKSHKPSPQWKIPVVFHNLRGYDSMLILPNIGDHHALGNIRVIPQQGDMTCLSHSTT
jgi:hypothetical protein